MNSIYSRSTAQFTTAIPSGFGMPACGHASVVTPVATAAAHTWLRGIDSVSLKAVARAAKATLTGDLGDAQPNHPGIRAWRPPIS